MAKHNRQCLFLIIAQSAFALVALVKRFAFWRHQNSPLRPALIKHWRYPKWCKIINGNRHIHHKMFNTDFGKIKQTCECWLGFITKIPQRYRQTCLDDINLLANFCSLRFRTLAKYHSSVWLHRLA